MAIPSALMNLMGRRRVDPMITEDARNRAASAASGGTLPGGSGVPVGTVMARENGQIVGGIRGAGTPQEMRIGDVMASSGPGLPAAPQAPAINQDFLAGRPAAGSGRIVPRADVKMTETDDGMGGKKTVKSYVWKGAELTMDQIMQPRNMAQFSDPMLAQARTGEVRRAMGLTPGGFGEAGLTNQERQRRLEAAMGPRPVAAVGPEQLVPLDPGQRLVSDRRGVVAEGAPLPAQQPFQPSIQPMIDPTTGQPIPNRFTFMSSPNSAMPLDFTTAESSRKSLQDMDEADLYKLYDSLGGKAESLQERYMASRLNIPPSQAASPEAKQLQQNVLTEIQRRGGQAPTAGGATVAPAGASAPAAGDPGAVVFEGVSANGKKYRRYGDGRVEWL